MESALTNSSKIKKSVRYNSIFFFLLFNILYEGTDENGERFNYIRYIDTCVLTSNIGELKNLLNRIHGTSEEYRLEPFKTRMDAKPW